MFCLISHCFACITKIRNLEIMSQVTKYQQIFVSDRTIFGIHFSTRQRCMAAIASKFLCVKHGVCRRL